jgi:hypothetical protein
VIDEIIKHTFSPLKSSKGRSAVPEGICRKIFLPWATLMPLPPVMATCLEPWSASIDDVNQKQEDQEIIADVKT